LLAQIDRAVAALDRFLIDGETSLAATAAGSQFRSDAAAMRRQLLQFRQQVAANEPAGLLSRSIREIEVMNRRLSDRAKSESRIERGGTRLDARGFLEPAQAISQLRG